MTAYQSYKLSRLRAVLLFLHTLPAISSRPSLQTRTAGLETIVDAIGEAIKTQALPLRGPIENREQALAVATHTALAVGGLVHGYAQKHKLPDLAAKVAVVPTDFRNCRRVERMQIAQRIHDAAATVIDALAEYEITPALLTRFQTQIDAADEAVDLQRATSDDKKTATAGLGALFRAADEFIQHELSPLFFLFKEDDPALYARYEAAIMILARPATRANAKPETISPATTAIGATSTPTALPATT